MYVLLYTARGRRRQPPGIEIATVSPAELDPRARPRFTYVRTYDTVTAMKRTATDLRADLYRILDHVAESGEPVEVVRGDVTLCIIRKGDAPRKRKPSPRTLPKLIVGNPDDLVHMEWPWRKGKGL